MPIYGQGWTPDQEEPDDVQPGDLAAGPRPDLTLNNDPMAMQARRYASVDPEARDKLRAPLQPPADDAAAAPAPADQGAEAPSQPVAVPKPPGGTGGGGGPALPKQALGISQGEQGALDRQSSADTEALNVNARKTGEEERKAGADLDLAQREQEAHQQFDQHAQKVRDDAHAYLRQQQEKSQKYEIRDYFDDKSAAQRVGAALFVGLGAFASAFTGGPNQALDIINGAIERDHKLKMLKAEKLAQGVTDARSAMKDAEIELAAQESGMLRKLADQRAVRLKKFGADDAKIAGDETRVKLLQEASARDIKAQQGIEDRIQEQRKLYVQETVGRSEAAKNYADAAKLKAEAGAGAGGKGDRAAGHKIDLGIFGAGVVDALKDADGLRLSPAEMAQALETVQKNETTLKSQEGPKSAVGAGLTNAGRAVGLIPKSRTEGLSDRQTQFINKLDIAQKKVATVLAGQGRANSHEMMEALRPQPGDSPDTIRKKMVEMSALGESAKAEAMQYGDIAAQAIERAKSAERPAAPQRVTQDEIAKVMDARRKARPGSPEWVRYTEMAKQMRAELGN